MTLQVEELRITTVSPVTQILVNAKRLIEERGWCQTALVWESGDDAYPTGSVCAIGAMNLAMFGVAQPEGEDGQLRPTTEAHPLFFTCANNIAPMEMLSDGPPKWEGMNKRWWIRSIEMWNDDDDRTKEQVIAAFDAAIKLSMEPNE